MLWSLFCFVIIFIYILNDVKVEHAVALTVKAGIILFMILAMLALGIVCARWSIEIQIMFGTYIIWGM